MVTATHSGTSAIDDAFMQEFMQDWQQAWNSHDPERVVAMMHPDCVYNDAGWHLTMRNHDDVRVFLRHTWRALPDLEFYWATFGRVPGEARAIAHWKARATMRGSLDPPGFAPTLDAVEFDGFDFHEYRDGKLANLRIVFNMMDVGRQIGAIPQAGSKMERGVVLMHNMQARLRRRVNSGS
jgi:steroid delta-isomerase-like uncharacterized protein